jgi:hypothetical protein
MSSQSLARALPPGAPGSVGETLQLAEMFFRSGFFADTRSAAAALVKIQAGRELGFGPMASMTGVHVIEGKPSIGAHLMAAMIRGSGRYDYEIVESNRDKCTIQFKRLIGKKWEELVPAITVTLQEFVDSGAALAKGGKELRDNWRKCPDDMLFARAISKGYRRHCPDLSCGVSVYVDGEIAADEPPVVVREVTAAPPSTNGTPTSPLPEEPSVTLQEALAGQEPVSGTTLDRIAAKIVALKIDESKAFAKARASYGSGRDNWGWASLTAAQAADLEAKLDAKIAQAKSEAAHGSQHLRPVVHADR